LFALFNRRFKFLEPGRLIDRELELVEPSEVWADDVLAACQHPLTQQNAPAEAQTTQASLLEFLQNSPRGHEAGAVGGRVPAYHFWMISRDPTCPVRVAGGIGLRIGDTPELRLFSGHIGYHVYPPARGRRYAERAVRLLLPLAKRHRVNPLWITVNPDNIASRRTCERVGATLVETISIPSTHEFYTRGERDKCRYRIRV